MEHARLAMSVGTGVRWISLLLVWARIASCQTFLEAFREELVRVQMELLDVDDVYGELMEPASSVRMFCSSWRAHGLVDVLFTCTGFCVSECNFVQDVTNSPDVYRFVIESRI